MPKLLRNKPHIFRLSSILSKEGNEPTFVLLYGILKELQTVHGWKIEVEQNTKHVQLYITLTAVTFLIINEIIFLLDQFQPHLPAVISTTRMRVYIN